MARLPKIIIMIAAMTAIFLWLSTAFNSCGNNADDLLGDATEKVSEGTEEFEDDFSDDIFEDDSDELFEDDDETYDSDYVAGDEADTEIEEVDFTASDDEPAYTAPAPTPTPTYSSSGGEYLVIAGNYLVESNARKMTRKLSNLGYPSADIGVFDRSQYHTVIASRQDSYGAALEISNAIKQQGIDCYVKKKQY